MSISLSFQSLENNIPIYCNYENHIRSFDDNIYFKNKNMNNDPIFDDKIDNFCNFITLYKKVEEEDLKKTQLLLNSKNKKGNSTNGYSYNVTNFQKQKNSKVWNAHVPQSNNEKLNSLIESHLNKICDESYKKISVDFINELINIDDIFYFGIISKKIVDKCVMDNKYQHLYIQLCNKIWSNRQIHYNLANIKEVNTKYYWSSKYEPKEYGPFNSEIDAKMNIYYSLNFKKYFMNYIQELFIHKNVNFTHIDNDEEFFLHKRQFMVIIEILGIMYNEKYINVDILHLVIMKLFHMNDMDTDKPNISSIEIDGILNIFKIMDDYKDQYNLTNYFKVPIFDEYYNYISQIENLDIFNLRTKYFLADCKDILKEKKKLLACISKDVITEKIQGLTIVEKFIQEKKKNNSNQMLSIYNKANEEDKSNILYEVIYRFCESNMRDESYEHFLRIIFEEEDKATKHKKQNKKDIKLLETNMNKIIMNLSEIYIDNPNIVSILKKFTTLIETFEIFDLQLHNQFIDLIDTQSQLIDDDDEDNNFF